MRAYKAISKLLKAAPRSAAWKPYAAEPYGTRNVDPNSNVRRVLYCVTITREVEDYFWQGKYDLLISHHPIMPWSKVPCVILHTPLDCCPGGLNDQWRKALKVRDARPMIDNLGWTGAIGPMPFEEIVARVRGFAGDIIGQIYSKKSMVESVVICTGLGGSVTKEAAATGADVYVTGELMQRADQVGTPAVIEVGHTLTERVGVNWVRAVLGSDVRVDCAPIGMDRFQREVYTVSRWRPELDDWSIGRPEPKWEPALANTLAQKPVASRIVGDKVVVSDIEVSEPSEPWRG